MLKTPEARVRSHLFGDSAWVEYVGSGSQRTEDEAASPRGVHPPPGANLHPRAQGPEKQCPGTAKGHSLKGEA